MTRTIHLPMRKTAWVLGAFLLVAGAWFFFNLRTWESPDFSISRRAIRHSNFSFTFEHWSEPGLTLLREQEKLAEISGTDQLDLFLNLCNWTHAQWKRSVPDPYPLSNALDILKQIRSGKTGGFCGQYAYVLADILKAKGYFAVRYAELWTREGSSHFVVEVWCDEYEKWMVLDPDYNLYYVTENGTPANCLDIRKSLFGGAAVHARSAAPGRGDKGTENTRYYANFAVSFRSDLMRHTRPLTVGDRFADFLFWKDEKTEIRRFKNHIPYAVTSNREEDFYFDCNCVLADLSFPERSDRVIIELTSQGSMPNFAGFAVSRSGAGGWRIIRGNRVELNLGKIPVLVEVAAVNRSFLRGCVTRIRIH